ncbi:hypothetical protein B0H11DRAFT_2185404 [Mycena galericulata]|nr:hypothetical protein B0H11DRAFT_2185404 [Mycena galericulata]
MASPPTTPASIPSTNLAAAAERRLQQHQGPPPSELQFSGPEHELRQKFRRLIDPGILRPNPAAQALASLKTLQTIAENLLREPDNAKFQQFKPTNSLIKRNLMDPRGTVEYARELGFYPDVQDFQPYYKFNLKKMDHLRIGAQMLREALALETEKEARAVHSKKEEKAIGRSCCREGRWITFEIRLAFEDDRKMKLLRDQMEKERRDARIAAAARHAELQHSMPRGSPNEEDADGDGDEDAEDETMPGSGNVLGSGSPSAHHRSPPSNKKTD